MVNNIANYVRQAESILTDETVAVRELVLNREMVDIEAVLFFCSPDYDLAKLTVVLKERFSCLVFGCTTAGEIASIYQTGGIVAASFSSQVFRFHLCDIHHLATFNLKKANQKVDEFNNRLSFSAIFNPEKMFAYILIDGVFFSEEQVVSCVHNALERVSLVYGSAAANRKFPTTHVFDGNTFSQDTITFSSDCVHGRREILEIGLQEEVTGLLANDNFVGFTPYEEQYNFIHVNQTLTGVITGEPN